MTQKIKNQRPALFGFTIIELVISVAVFVLITSAFLGSFLVLTRNVKAAREKIILSNLSTYYLEIVRNMPYSQIGTQHGNPSGSLPDCGGVLPNCPYATSQTIGGTIYKIYYKVIYIHDPADPAPISSPSYKQVKMSVLNTATSQVTDFVTTVVPKGVITNPNTGALQVNVINAQGQPLPGISVEIRYPAISPYTLDLFDTTDSTGQVLEIGLPPAVNNYRVIASKAGYSTDQTYPITAQNPNPIHPDPTIVAGQVTQLTLSVDLLSTLNIKTLNQFCQPISGVGVNVKGAKLIGTPTSMPTPDSLYKFNNNYTSPGNGIIALNNLEWDTYTPTLLSGQNYIIYGTSPIQKIDVLPGTSQTYSMILGTNSTSNSLLVIVKDAASGAPLENAAVHLQKGGSQPQDYYGTTGGSVWVQSDWTGGAGVAQWSTTTPNVYFQDNGNIDVNSAPTGVRLLKTSGRYTTATGTVESSTFDTGTNATNYTIISWRPSSQSASTTLAFQVAANNDNATWNYVGPDGTPNTYFAVPGTDIGPIIDNNRYVRYKAYLSTQDDKKTPVLTSINLNFVTGCFTPGQTMFTALTAGNNYNLTVSLAGYSDQVINSLTITANQTIEVLMSP
jgi:hypothetical protein